MVRVTEDSRTFCLHPEVEKERTTFQGSCISMVVLYTVILHSHLLNFSLYRSLMLKGSKVFKEGRRLRLFKFSVCLPLLWYSLLYWTQGSVQSLSRVWLSSTPWTAACQASLSITNSWSLCKLMSIESVMPSNHLILCHPLLLLPSIFPSIRSFPVSHFFASGGQSIGISTSASALPMNIQDWFLLGWPGWIALQSKGLSRVFSNTTIQKHQLFGAQLSL